MHSVRIEIAEETADALGEYSDIPIAFEVGAVVEVAPSPADPHELLLTERALAAPLQKDYDAYPGARPLEWPHRFDLTTWGFLAARQGAARVGGAALILGDSTVDMGEGREDLAVLWDIRVTPEARGHGVGSALLAAAEDWVRRRGGRWLKAETQNINVAACRFYARHGFVLRAANADAYPDCPGEIQLLWYKHLADSHAPTG